MADIAMNEQGTVTRHRVDFVVAGDRLVGDLHLPAGPGPHAAVVVAGPMTSVKEQVTGRYAQALAERGVAAMAIDHRGFGESAGSPRQYEHWGRKVADLRAAVERLAADERIDPARIGAAGVCLGCGYAATTAAEDPMIRSLGLVAGYYRDPQAMRDADPEGFDAKVAQGRQARERYETTGALDMIPAASLTQDAAMQSADTFDYYTRRAAVPNYSNRFAVMSREHFLPFDVQRAAPKITVPVAMVHAENALSPHWARRFHNRLTTPKTLRWLEAKSQTAFYDDPALVDAAADILAAHFHSSLNPAPD